jgi:hypothetical protein
MSECDLEIIAYHPLQFLCHMYFVQRPSGEKIGSFVCFIVAMECAASKCANVQWPPLCPAALCITFMFMTAWVFVALQSHVAERN